MAVMKAFPELIDKKTIERAKKLNPALLCDGMKTLGIPMDGCMEAAVMPVNPDPDMIMVGTAVTVSTDNGDNFPIHVATYAGGPGYVMVVDGKGYRDRPYFGDLVAGAAQAVGYEGIVVDGFNRDKSGIIALGFPVFSKGIMQRGVLKQTMGDINVPVLCGGLIVKPGDLVMGGADGVTVVPREHIETVLQKAEEKQAYEERRDAVITAYAEAREHGTALPKLAPQWVDDLLQRQKK